MKRLITLFLFSVMLTGCAEQTTAPTVETPEPEEIAIVEPVNDDCSKLSEYQKYEWFAALNKKYEEEFLVPQELKGTVGSKFGQGCLKEDLFIFIPEFFEFGCGKVFSYDTVNDVLNTPADDPDTPGPDYCATEFGEYGDESIVFNGNQADGGTCTHYFGEYFFIENRVEVEIGECVEETKKK